MQAVPVDDDAGPPHSDLVTLGQAIKDVLREQGLNQAELARRLGMDDGHVTRLVKGQIKGVALDFVRRIEDVLDLHRGELLRRAGYVEDLVSVRDAIAMDPSLTLDERRIVLRTYDLSAEASGRPTSRSGSVSSPPARASTRRS